MISRGHYWTSVQFLGPISCLYKKVSYRYIINISVDELGQLLDKCSMFWFNQLTVQTFHKEY